MPGWIWDVFPVKSTEPMVANGQSGDEGKARALVQQVLADEAGAGWGMILGPGGQTDVCRRGRQPGTFRWKPLFSADLQAALIQPGLVILHLAGKRFMGLDQLLDGHREPGQLRDQLRAAAAAEDQADHLKHGLRGHDRLPFPDRL